MRVNEKKGDRATSNKKVSALIYTLKVYAKAKAYTIMQFFIFL